MAFSRSRILRVVTKYSQELESPYSLDPKKMLYDPNRYGYQYSNKMINEGFEKGARFLNRIPRYREMHPEILDAIKAQRMILLYSIIGIFFFIAFVKDDTNRENREIMFQLFKEKQFIGRYSYLQREVEYIPRIAPPYHS